MQLTFLSRNGFNQNVRWVSWLLPHSRNNFIIYLFPGIPRVFSLHFLPISVQLFTPSHYSSPPHPHSIQFLFLLSLALAAVIEHPLLLVSNCFTYCTQYFSDVSYGLEIQKKRSVFYSNLTFKFWIQLVYYLYECTSKFYKEPNKDL